MQFTYHINKDERGHFEADVRNPFDKTVFTISGGGIFEDGFMKNKTDVDGLQDYLRQLQIISPTDTVKDFETMVSGVHAHAKSYRSQLLDQYVRGEKFEGGGGFSLEYLNDPDYIALDEEYKQLLADRSKYDKTSLNYSSLSAKIENIQRKKKRIALGESFKPSEVVPVRNLYYRKTLNPLYYEKGGSLIDAKSMLEDYEPAFQYFEKSDVIVDDKNPEQKNYSVQLQVPRDVFDNIEYVEANRESAIEHFKKFGHEQGLNKLIYDVTTNNKLEIVLSVTEHT